MASTQWAWILLLTGLGHCYDNLIIEQGARVSQSSEHQGLSAVKAHDGSTLQDYSDCSHTAVGESKAWLEVDLGGKYSLKSVKIYYRNEIGWPPYRFRQFYLDVSNASTNSPTTMTSQRKRCYKDNTTAPATPPAVIDIPCKETARYVIVETTYNAQEAINRNQSGPVLEICEIEVYGNVMIVGLINSKELYEVYSLNFGNEPPYDESLRITLLFLFPYNKNITFDDMKQSLDVYQHLKNII